MTPNDLLDHHMAQLSGTEFKVVMYVARRTIGFNRQSDAISLSQLVSGLRRPDGTVLDAGTGEPLSSVRRAVAGLVARGYLIATARRDAAGGDLAKSYALRLPPHDQSDHPPRVQGEHPPLLSVSIPHAQGGPHNRKTGRQTERQKTDDDMPAVQPAASSSRSGLAAQRGLVGEPTQLLPTSRPEPVAPEALPAEIAAGLPALLEALGESRGSDTIKRRLVKTWREWGPDGPGRPALTAALFRRAIEACRDESRSQARDSYGAYFTSQLTRFVADAVAPPRRVGPHRDDTSAAQRAAEPAGRAWRDLVPDLSEAPRIPPPLEPPRFLEPVPILRVTR